MQPDATATTPGVLDSDAHAAAIEQRLRGELERRIGPRNLQHWFGPQTSLRACGDELRVAAGSPFLLSWMQKQFRESLNDVARAVLGPSGRATFEVDATLSLGGGAAAATVDRQLALVPPFEADAPLATDARPVPSLRRATSAVDRRRDGEAFRASAPGPLRLQIGDVPVAVKDLDEPRAPRVATTVRKTNAAHETQPASNVRATSESKPSRTGRRYRDLGDFVVGPCNELAALSARQVAEAPGGRYNPLFLHGGVGTGKTHLLEGMYRALRRQSPSLNVLLLSAEAFANYFTEAIRDHAMPGFRQRFRTVDVLLIDDVDFLDAKKGIQEEFLHTFQQLESHGRQIVLSADRHPRLLSKLSEDLTTRFVSGLVCRLESPDAETRRKIVEARAARLDADIAPEALAFVAQRFKHNVRELEGALHCLETAGRMLDRRVTLPLARRVLSDLERDCIRIVRLSDVERTVCGFFGIAPQQMKSAGRTRTLTQPRMLAMFLARKLTQSAYAEIGQFFGGRNHSTVMAAERKVLEWLTTQTPIQIASQSWPVADVLQTLEEQLRAG